MTDSKSTKDTAAKAGGWRKGVSWLLIGLFTAEVLAALFMPRAADGFAGAQFPHPDSQHHAGAAGR
jgi:hypothetical protein